MNRTLKSQEILAGNKWVQLIENTYSDNSHYTILHEVSRKGHTVVVLPFRRTVENGVQYLVRNEMTPPWKPNELVPSSVTGGVDVGMGAEETALKELKEETGYLALPEHMTPLGTCYTLKGCDTINHLFAIDVTNTVKLPRSESDSFENEAENEWIDSGDIEKILGIVDPLWYAVYVRHTMHYMKTNKL